MSTNNESFLSGSNLVSFDEGVTTGLRQDIMDCLLYAQLKAEREYPDGHQWRSKLGAYTSAIHDAGASYSSGIADYTMMIHRLADLHRLPFGLVGSTVELRELFDSSLEALLASEHAQAFFGSWFSSGRSESFQVVPCVAHGKDDATIMLCGLQMTTMAFRPAPWFWQVVGGEMRVHCAVTEFRFSRRMFDPERERIHNALARETVQKIIHL